MKYVYVVAQNGSWDYEESDKIFLGAFDSFEKALKSYETEKQCAIEDMKEWVEEEDTSIDEDIDKENGSAEFSIYETGDYSRVHSTIIIERLEVQ